MKNSRAKGKRGELEFARVLQNAGYHARRGQQFKGGAGSPDVICDELSGYHFEVKRTQAGNPYKWLAQAINDAGPGKTPIVAHRRNGDKWIAVLAMDDLLELIGLAANTDGG